MSETVQKQNYKQTEVGLIPEDWEVKSLDELTVRVGDGIHSTPKYTENGDYLFINGNNLVNGKIIITNDTKNVDISEQKKHSRELNNQTILLSINGTIGNVAYYNNEKILLGKSAAYLNIKKSFPREFFYYSIQTPEIQIFFENNLTGSTIKNLGLNTIRKAQIPFPPTLIEQHAIATALNDMDELLTSLEQLISKKQAIKQGAMQELLTPPHKGGNRLPGFSGEWEEIKLGKCCEFHKGKGLPKSEIIEDGRFRCIHYGELFTKYYEIIKCVESKTNKSENTLISRSNDVLMPTSDVTPNGLATASAIFEDDIILGGDVLVIRPTKKLHGSFLAFQVSANRQQIMSLVTGSTVYHLYGSDMSKFKFYIPNIEEQKAIAQVLSDMDEEIKALEEKKEKYQKIKGGMMQELLTGKIRLV